MPVFLQKLKSSYLYIITQNHSCNDSTLNLLADGGSTIDWDS